MVIRMPLLLTPLWRRKSLKLQLDIKVDKGSEPTLGKVHRADLPFPCVFKYVARCHMKQGWLRRIDGWTTLYLYSRHTQHLILMGLA